MEFRHWLDQHLSRPDKKAAELARLLNIGPDKVSKMRSGDRQPKAAELPLIERYVGERAPLDSGAPEPLRVPLGHEFPRDPDPDEPMTAGSETGRRGIPDDASALLDVTAGMGAGGVTIISPGVPGKHGMTFAAEHVRDYWRIPGEILTSMHMRPGDVTVVQVQGDSMAGTLIEDDYVFVDTRHRLPSPDGIYALGDEFGGIVVKRLEVIGPDDDDTLVLVKSDNPKHEPKTRRLSEMRIIGRVVRRFGVVM